MPHRKGRTLLRLNAVEIGALFVQELGYFFQPTRNLIVEQHASLVEKTAYFAIIATNGSIMM